MQRESSRANFESVRCSTIVECFWRHWEYIHKNSVFFQIFHVKIVNCILKTKQSVINWFKSITYVSIFTIVIIKIYRDKGLNLTRQNITTTHDLRKNTTIKVGCAYSQVKQIFSCLDFWLVSKYRKLTHRIIFFCLQIILFNLSNFFVEFFKISLSQSWSSSLLKN